VTTENTDMDKVDQELAKAEKELADVREKQATGVVTPAAAEPTPKPDPAPAPDPEPQVTPAATDPNLSEVQRQKAELEAEIEALNKRKRDLNGEIGGELSRRSQAKVAELSSALAQAQTELAALKAQPKPAPASADILSDEQLLAAVPEADRDAWSEMFKGSSAMVRKAMQTVLEQSNKSMDEKLSEIRGRVEAEDARRSAEQRDRFTEAVEQKAPGFAEVNGKGGKAFDPQWVEFLDTVKPGTRISWRQSIENVSEDAVSEAATAHVAFQKSMGIAPAPKKTVTPPTGQVQPRRSGTSVEVTPERQTDPMTEMNELLKARETGKISDEEFEKKTRRLAQKIGTAPAGD